MSKFLRGILCGCIGIMMMIPQVSISAADEVSVEGTYSIVVEGYDWGPGVSKTILTLDEEVDSIDKDDFTVYQETNGDESTKVKRTVTNAYTSDESGNEVSESSKYVTIEMAVSPSEGSPFTYNFVTGYNTWTEPYNLIITLKDGSEIKSGSSVVDELDIDTDYTERITPTYSLFSQGTYEADGDITMSYAYYEPETTSSSEKSPLVIWLHGAGEGGGYDTSINVLGNKVTALVSDEIQEEVGDAYVLCPQCPTMWMDSTGNADYTTDGTSIYTESLMNLIKEYVSENPNIDTSRIYIGGCSNGGYMTMNLVLNNPDYFAAAYPICEAYSDEWITDEMLEGIKDLPIWFTYADNDTIVDPETNSKATAERLTALGNDSVKVSEFENVVDTSGLYKDEDGNAYEYLGHWSWIYAFNDECKDGDDSLWTWLGEQVNSASSASTESTKKMDTKALVALIALGAVLVGVGCKKVFGGKKDK